MTKERTLLPPVVKSTIPIHDMRKAVETVKTRTDCVAALQRVVGKHRSHIILSTGEVFPFAIATTEDIFDKLIHAAKNFPNPQEGSFVACLRFGMKPEDSYMMVFRNGEWDVSYPYDS